MILEGNITIPYKWTTGATIGRFLTELRDHARIVGARCENCGTVYVPPPDICGECYKPLTDWIALGGVGEAIACTTVEHSMPWSPMPPPYTLALIKLDGASTSLVHLVKAGVQAGDRVRAIFKSNRTGTLLDIEHFAPLTEVMDSKIMQADDSYSQATGQPQTTEPEVEAASTPISLSTGILQEGTDYQVQPVNDVATVFRALPGRFRSGVATKPLVYYFSIDDEQWTVFVGPEACEVKSGKAVENADCFLKTSKVIFLGTINGTHTPSMTDLVTGRVKTNNPMLLLTFREIFS
jgi:uncharacterized OB-fold protein